MSAEFSFKGLEITDKSTKRYTFYPITGEPWVEVAPALETNRPYYNAILRRTKKNARRRISQVSAAMLQEQRDEDRELFAKHIVKGWGNLKDTTGNPVTFSEKSAFSFLSALPDWLFDELRAWCGDANNFLKEDDMTEEEVEETGKS